MRTPQEQAARDLEDVAREFQALYEEKLRLIQAVKTPEQLKGLLEIFYTKGAHSGAQKAVKAMVSQLW